MTQGLHTIRVYVDDTSGTGWGKDDIFIKVYNRDGVLKNETSGQAQTYFELTVETGADEVDYWTILVTYDDDGTVSDQGFKIYVDGNLIYEIHHLTTSIHDKEEWIRETLKVIRPYTFSIEESVLTKFVLDKNPTGSSVYLYLYDPNAQEIARNESDTVKVSIEETLDSPGGWVTVIEHYRGSSTLSYTLETIFKLGPEFNDYYDYNNTDAVAFAHTNKSRGIGFILLDLQKDFSASTSLVWVNEGNNSATSDDYIYWAINMSVTSINPGDTCTLNYVVYPWNVSGTTHMDRFADFNITRYELKQNLQVTRQATERFRIEVQVTVYDDNTTPEPIPDANITVIDTATSTIVDWALTDSQGIAKLNLERKSYNFRVVLTSAKKQYINETVSKDYSDSTYYSYSVHSDAITIRMYNLVKLTIKALNNNTSPSQPIQSAYYRLYNTTNYNDPDSWLIEGYTNLTGAISIYIPQDNWNLEFNATKTTPEDWDEIALYNDSAFTQLFKGPARKINFDVVETVTYYLYDKDVSYSKTPTELRLVNTPSVIEKYWLENFSFTVKIVESETENEVNGTIHWYIFGTGNVLWDSGSGDSRINNPYTLTYNTSSLDAGATYTILINATLTTDYLLPSPITITLSVLKRPIYVSMNFEPGSIIFWNESLSISVSVTDRFSSDPISGANVTLKVLGGNLNAPLSFQLDEDPNNKGIYRTSSAQEDILTSLNVGVYTVIADVGLKNYESAEETDIYTLQERPTDLIVISYIVIPWVDSYNISADYKDTRLSRIIAGASLEYRMYDANGYLVSSDSMSYLEGTYLAELNLTGLKEGTYQIEITADKDNYESKLAFITFIVREHLTELTVETTKVTVYYGEQVTVSLEYKDLDFLEGIANAETNFDVLGVEEGMPSISGSLFDLGNGTYLLNFSTTALGCLGSYIIDVTLDKTHYSAQHVLIYLVIKEIPTVAIPSKLSEELEWGLSISIDIYLNETLSNTRIEADLAYFE
ncbi:MAG: hypothetical protein DRQ06_05865, partial [Candidatus Hydrothermota bacterium]